MYILVKREPACFHCHKNCIPLVGTILFKIILAPLPLPLVINRCKSCLRALTTLFSFLCKGKQRSCFQSHPTSQLSVPVRVEKEARFQRILYTQLTECVLLWTPSKAGYFLLPYTNVMSRRTMFGLFYAWILAGNVRFYVAVLSAIQCTWFLIFDSMYLMLCTYAFDAPICY